MLSRTGSLRAAAAELHQTQSALSKALREAEAMLGGPLFERTGRGLRPLPEGHVAVRGAALLMSELAHLQEEVLATRGGAQAVLRVGAPPFVALSVLPPALDVLVGRSPPVQVRLLEERVPRLYEALAAGRLDALVTTVLADAPELQGAGLRHENLLEAEIAVIAPARHPLARARTVTWAKLSAERWVVPGRDAFVRRLVDEMFLRAGAPAPVALVESTNPLTNVRLVACGIGLSCVPAPAAREAERAGSVRRLRVAPAIAPVPVALVTRGDSNPRVAALREALAGAA